MMSWFAVAIAAFAGVGALMIFGDLLGIQVTAQPQAMVTENSHTNTSSNQLSISNAAEQLENITLTVDDEIVTNNGMVTTRWMSLVDGVKVVDILIIDSEHVAINLRYEGEDEPPGLSIAVITNSSSSSILNDNEMYDFTSSSNYVRVVQSGSNYLESGWEIQHPDSANVFVQLDGKIPEEGHMTVIVIPFLHH
jgi:hypothetical protein